MVVIDAAIEALPEELITTVSLRMPLPLTLADSKAEPDPQAVAVLEGENAPDLESNEVVL